MSLPQTKLHAENMEDINYRKNNLASNHKSYRLIHLKTILSGKSAQVVTSLYNRLVAMLHVSVACQHDVFVLLAFSHLKAPLLTRLLQNC